MTERRLNSLCPTRPAKIRPASSRSSGTPKTLAVALAVSDFPVPGMPIMSSPFGTGRPYARAFLPNALRRFNNQSLSTSKPPMEASDSFVSMISSSPFFLIAWAFSRAMTAGRVQHGFTFLFHHRRKLGRLNDAVEHPAKLFLSRKREFQNRQLAFQFRRQTKPATQYNERFVADFGVLQRVFQLPQQHGIGVAAQEQVEIPQEDDCFLGQFLDGQQGFHRVIGLTGCSFLGIDQARRR